MIGPKFLVDIIFKTFRMQTLTEKNCNKKYLKLKEQNLIQESVKIFEALLESKSW